ncbi:MAG: NAD-dependent epimerase/dehydratase family protein [Nitrospirae bacterium]|nr:NAD-dependent epimerase/dehydratase family protein [Nitrospirota bacterium]MBF0554110.1 NAD-dependent epimerase/dehydratase family protein [Nitrospirota bacterium]
MNVLITGASGFIGRYLSRVLLEKSFNVRAIIRSQGKAIFLPVGVTITIAEDVAKIINWQDILKGIDVIIHLANRVHVMNESSNNPLNEYRRINTHVTQTIAEQAAIAGVKRIIYLSTIKVNGEKTVTHPFTENDAPNPQDYYAVSKLEAEQTLSYVSKKTGVEFVILRPALVYGPGVKGNFYTMLKFIRNDIPLPLLSIKNSRSYIYIGNISDAIIHCIEHPDAANKVFLISDAENLSTPELISRLSSAFNKKSRLCHCPVPMLSFIGTVTGHLNVVNRLKDSLVVDSSRIREELAWTPAFTTTQGLNETVDWFKRNG